MTKTLRKPLLIHTFQGERFAGASLEVECLSELISLKSIVVGIAKNIWKLRNPKAKKLPNHFKENFNLLMFEISEGSAVVPLERQFTLGENEIPFDSDDEFDEAAEVFVEAISSVRNGHGMPEQMPKSVLFEFENYGKFLRDDESFLIEYPRTKKVATYNADIRNELKQWQPSSYQDTHCIEGELRMVDVDTHKFKLLTTSGQRLTGEFSPSKEAMMIEALKQHETRRIKLTVQAEIDSITGAVSKILGVEDYELVLPHDERIDFNAKPLRIIAQEIMSDVPESEWSKLPDNLSELVDEISRGSK